METLMWKIFFSYCINNFSASSPCLIISPQRNSKSSDLDISYLAALLSRNAKQALLIGNFRISGSFLWLARLQASHNHIHKRIYENEKT